MSHIEIEVARYAGVCYGVERALGMAEKAADEAREPVNTLGPLIHNPLVVNDLESIGVGTASSVSEVEEGTLIINTLGPLIHNPLVVNDLESIGVGTASSVSEVEEGTLIIRTHGVVPSVVEDARTRGLDVLAATCPYVKKVHHAAERLVREGYQLIVVGESGHPEVEGIMGHAGDDAHVVSVPGDLDAIDLSRKVGVVVQTTQTPGALADVVAELSKRRSRGLRSRGSRRHRSFAQGRRGRADPPDARSAGRCRCRTIPADPGFARHQHHQGRDSGTSG